MNILKVNDVACCSKHKVQGICENCMRNVSLANAPVYENWETFKPEKRTNLKIKNKSSFSCDGFSDKREK